MKEKTKEFLIALMSFVIFLAGVGGGLIIADSFAKSVCFNTELLDITELCLQEDYDVTITSIDYRNARKTNRVYFKGFYNDDENKEFYCVCKLTRVAPFRYEWVEKE